MNYGQRRKDSLFGSVDWVALILYLLLVTVGVVAVFSASWVEDSENVLSFSHNYIKQIVWLGISLVVGVVLMLLDRSLWHKIAYFLYAAAILALVASCTITYYMADNRTDMIFFGVALYALLSGLILIVLRKRIFAHLCGFLVIENGVFLFSMAIGVEFPILINLAIMLDILISILILGMFLQRLDNDIHSDETDALTSIKD